MWQRHVFDSSFIHEAGYDKEKARMFITFKNHEEVTKTFYYEDVSQDFFDAFCAAPSAGRFFHLQIKGKIQGTEGVAS